MSLTAFDPAMQQAAAQYAAWSALSNVSPAFSISEGSLGQFRAPSFDMPKFNFLDLSPKSANGKASQSGEGYGLIAAMDNATQQGWRDLGAWVTEGIDGAGAALGRGADAAGRAGTVALAATVSALTPHPFSGLSQEIATPAAAPMAALPIEPANNNFAGIELPESLIRIGMNIHGNTASFAELSHVRPSIGGEHPLQASPERVPSRSLAA